MWYDGPALDYNISPEMYYKLSDVYAAVETGQLSKATWYMDNPDFMDLYFVPIKPVEYIRLTAKYIDSKISFDEVIKTKK